MVMLCSVGVGFMAGVMFMIWICMMTTGGK